MVVGGRNSDDALDNVCETRTMLYARQSIQLYSRTFMQFKSNYLRRSPFGNINFLIQNGVNIRDCGKCMLHGGWWSERGGHG